MPLRKSHRVLPRPLSLPLGAAAATLALAALPSAASAHGSLASFLSGLNPTALSQGSFTNLGRAAHTQGPATVTTPSGTPVVATSPAAAVILTSSAAASIPPTTPDTSAPVATPVPTPAPTPAPTSPTATTPSTDPLATITSDTGATVVATASTVAATVSAAADTVVSPVSGDAVSAASCESDPESQAFASVGDTADYSLAPGGDFENGTSGWTLSGGASITSGNETLGVSPGSKSLSMPAGSVAISPAFCVDDSRPTFRFAARSDGQLTGYQAIVLYRDSDGTLTQAQFTSSSDQSLLPSTWQASAVSPLATKIPLLTSSPTASVQLMFVSDQISPLGAILPTAFGTVSIDSVMVDPYRRG